MFEGDGKKLSVQLSRPSPKAWTFKAEAIGPKVQVIKHWPRGQGVALRTISLVLTLVVFVGHKTLASRPRRDLEDYITGFDIGSVCRS